jgi:hypothetical protein
MAGSQMTALWPAHTIVSLPPPFIPDVWRIAGDNGHASDLNRRTIGPARRLLRRRSQPGLLGFIAEAYAGLPDDLNVKVCEARGVVQLLRLEAEVDEMWSFVARKENKSRR